MRRTPPVTAVSECSHTFGSRGGSGSEAVAGGNGGGGGGGKGGGGGGGGVDDGGGRLRGWVPSHGTSTHGYQQGQEAR